MKHTLSAWWEQTPKHGYVAKRSLVVPGAAEKFAPLTHFIVYYCGADFTPEQVTRQLSGLTYCIIGEKEPPNAPPDGPWMDRAEELADIVGGAIRQDEPEIIPILYVQLGFEGFRGSREFTSDQVPLSEDDNRRVRVLAGQFENVAHSVPVPSGVTMLDVVLKQGGTFEWQLPPGQRAGIYVIGGQVQVGKHEPSIKCRADSLVWATGKQAYVTAACAGGRFLLFTVPGGQTKHAEAYVQEVLPVLDQIKN